MDTCSVLLSHNTTHIDAAFKNYKIVQMLPDIYCKHEEDAVWFISHVVTEVEQLEFCVTWLKSVTHAGLLYLLL
jgi:hypothetical protein